MEETRSPWSVRLSPDLRVKLLELAEHGHRKASDQVRMLIDQAHTQMVESEERPRARYTTGER